MKLFDHQLWFDSPRNGARFPREWRGMISTGSTQFELGPDGINFSVNRLEVPFDLFKVAILEWPRFEQM